jgi:hypothetical protein
LNAKEVTEGNECGLKVEGRESAHRKNGKWRRGARCTK